MITKQARIDLAEVMDKHGLVFWSSEWGGVSSKDRAFYEEDSICYEAGIIDSDYILGEANESE